MTNRNCVTTMLACLAILVPAQALAWTALAYSPEQGVSYLYYMAKSAEEAEKEALAGCKRAANGCLLLGETRDGPLATMVVSGEQAVARGSDADPRQAFQRAMHECQRLDTGCRLVSAAWDRGTHIMGVAIDQETAWVGSSQSTESAAREEALGRCRAASRKPDACTLFHVLNGPGWVAVARGTTATGVGLSVRSSDIAVRNALAECESAQNAVPASCTDIVTHHNPAGTPEPAHYRELAQRIHADRRAMTASVPPFLGRPEP
jgi:hypothetical protein